MVLTTLMQHRNTNYGRNVSADRTEILTHHSTPNCDMLRLIQIYPATKSGRSESVQLVIEDYILTVFIRRPLVDDNTASECIRTVAATYGCKTLQLYEYDANVYGNDANCE